MEALEKLSYQNPIVLIDGQCVLCHGFTQFLIKRDKKGVLRFGTLQESIKIIEGLNEKSVILISKGNVRKKSGAGIRILGHLGGLWKLSLVLLIIPWFLRDWAYSFIAKNRYQWFGKYEECLVPERNISVYSSS